jgi:uncharacterized protein (DUF58 family)
MAETISSSKSSSKSIDNWIDMAALMRIKDMQLRAKCVVDGFHNGLHRSPLHGFSVEFSEYRPFSEGDDPRTIDWKLFARSDRYYIKKFEDETNRRCYLVVDQSKSMEFGSLGYKKIDYARTLAATLGYYLTLQRDAVGLLTFEATVTEFLTARFRPGQLKRILTLLEKPTQGTATDLQQPLSHLADMVRQRSLILIVSDFLVPVESLRQPLSFLRARNHEVMLLRVLDPAEVDLSWSKSSMLLDLESGREMYVNPDTVRTTYRKNFGEHERAMIEMCGQLGIGWTSLTTDASMEHALFDLLYRQQQTGSRSSRSRSNRVGGVSKSGVGGSR